MHRILNIAGNEKNNDDLIEQPVADFLFISSVKADLNLISSLLLEEEFAALKNNIRALEISNLNSSTQIDNYFLKTVNYAKVVVLRLFGDKGTWSYGLEQLLNWQAANNKRRLIILSGTVDQELSLCELSSIDKNTAFIRGVKELVGAPVMSTDIRASAALIIAALAANGSFFSHSGGTELATGTKAQKCVPSSPSHEGKKIGRYITYI